MNQDRRTFLRNSALTGGALSLHRFAIGERTKAISTAQASGDAQNSTAGALVRQQFQSPPKKYRPIVRWWWPGNNVNDAELRREIAVLDKCGIGGAEIQAFVKGFPPDTFSSSQWQMVNSYATPSFFNHVATAADEAQKHGMFIDYTFGSGWPFGGGDAITPELASVELSSTHLSVEGPATFHAQLQIPSVTDGDPSHGSDILNGLPEGWADRLKKRTRVAAVVAVRGEDAQWDFHQDGPHQALLQPGQLLRGSSVDLTNHLQPDGVLHWDVPPGTWQLFVFCTIPTVQRINAGAGPGPQLVLDHLSSDAFKAHARRVGGDAIPILGKYFGNSLRAIFCDSLEVSANLFWSDDFLEEFRRRRGYELVPYLPILKLQSVAEPFGRFSSLPIFDMPEIGDQVRHDYRQTVSDLIIERFYSQFNQWAHDHQLLSRTQAHGAPAHVLRIYGEADIPETENLFDNGNYDFLKMASSSAHVYGRSIVGSESFVWPQLLYETTPQKMKLAVDELVTAGVNAIVYHGFGYVVPEIPQPGWHPFSGMNGGGNYSSQLNELNPFWPYLAQLNGYIARLQYISQSGRNIAALALYLNDLVHGAYEMPPPPILNQSLLDAGYNYDHINAESLVRCSVRESRLVTAGGASYRALVLPSLHAIDPMLAGMLPEWANAGLPIFFSGQVPDHDSGFHGYESETARVRDAMHSLHASGNVHFCADVAATILNLKSAVTPDVRFYGPALPFIQKQVGRLNAFFLRNATDAEQHLDAEFDAEGDPELWDPWNGEIRPIAGSRRAGVSVRIELDLDPMASALIVFDPEKSPHAAPTPTAKPDLKRIDVIGSHGWKLVATGLAPSGKTATIHRDLPLLVDWSLDSELRGISGRGVYTTSFTAPAMESGDRLILDLGIVRDVAEVKVNGKQAAVLLLRPYQIDISQLVEAGENSLEIMVTNTLFNSMALREPRAFRLGTTENPSGLMSSGLIGPVQLKIMG